MVTAVPVKSTIKKINSQNLCVDQTLNRDELWEIQTPQMFKRNVLLDAHAKKWENVPTDDAMMVEEMGVKVKVYRGDYMNIKITTQEDLTVAEAFLCRSSKA